jgi:hypothetical protein
MVEQARRRNVFARHSWENSFYLRRIGQLEEATVIEVLVPGALASALPVAQRRAELVEKVAFISAIFGIQRERMHKLLALSRHRRYGFDIAISPGFRYLRSSQRQETEPRGIRLDDTFVRRFNRCGFASVVSATESGTGIATRLQQGVNWLFESRQETSIHAAVIKTAIALESLLISTENESLRAPLAERAAFLLSDEPARRRRIASVVKSFYDLRSNIVHGGHRRLASVPATALEGIDRIVLLLLLTIAANSAAWASFDRVVAAVEDRRWGVATKSTKRPFPSSHLSRALRLAENAVRGGTAKP